MIELLQTLRARRFDAVWDMQGLFRSGVMALAARAPEKWGRRDAREGAGLFVNRRADLPSGPGPHHAIEILQGFPRAIGLDGTIEFPLELKRAKTFSWETFFEGDPAKRFVIFTDSRGVEKEWRRFGDLTHLIWRKIPDSRVAWCAGQRTEPSGDIPADRFLNLTGCPLDEMIELVRQPSVFIGNDSGPMHLSAAFGNRVVAIFGPTSPRRFGPWPPGAARTRCVVAPNGRLADLQPETVLKALQEFSSKRE